MKNKLISYVENKYNIINNINIPKFRVGYFLEVKIWVIEGNKKRIQSFEGLVISKINKGLNSSFILRKISYNEGVEKLFKIYSPIIYSIIVKKKRKFRKSKLYYLRFNNKKFLRSSN